MDLIPVRVDENGIKRHPLFQFLMRVDFDLTGLCNRQCSFCPRSLDANPVYPNINKHLPLETIQIVIDELRSIDFTGWIELAGRGESTLHKHFDTVVDMLTTGPRKWKVRLTTNGYELDDWWNSPIGMKLDQLLLNSYESKEQYIERQEKYKVLPSGGKVYHYYKQDGFTIDQINNMPGYMEDGRSWKHAFNNRAGYFKEQDRRFENLDYTNIVKLPNGRSVNIADSPCWHPMRQIFIDYEGNYQMCCNDWSSQIKIGNVTERSLIDMYLNDEKINRIRWRLLNKDRKTILPCYMCDDMQGVTVQTKKVIEKFRNSKAYREHVVPLARLGKKYDEGLSKGT